MKRVIIESPYAGDVARNLRYVRACMRDALMRGEAPFASHALYTQPGVLNDDVPGERELGIRAGFAWRAGADTVVYEDLGTSRGMELGIESARLQRGLIEWRVLGDDWDTGAPDTEQKALHAEARLAELVREVRDWVYDPDACAREDYDGLVSILDKYGPKPEGRS